MNAFKHGLAAIQKRREERITTEYEESVRQQIIFGSALSAAIHFAERVKGGISLAERERQSHFHGFLYSIEPTAPRLLGLACTAPTHPQGSLTYRLSMASWRDSGYRVGFFLT
jgi:hypothetical protein